MRQKREELQKNNPNQELLARLSSYIYITGSLIDQAERNVPAVNAIHFFSRDVDSMHNVLNGDQDYVRAMRRSANMDPGQASLENPMTHYQVVKVGLEAEVPGNDPLQRNFEGASLEPEKRALRVALLRQTLREMEATGTGCSVLPIFSRRRNSEQFENLKREVRRQLAFAEGGLPLGVEDDRRMFAALNAYTAGERAETRGYEYGRIRQRCAFRLYGEYLNHHGPWPQNDPGLPTREQVEQRLNTARRALNPAHEDHVDLGPDGPYVVRGTPVNSAKDHYDQAVQELNNILNARGGAGAALTPRQQTKVTELITRLDALQHIIVADRAGSYAFVDSQKLLRYMQESRDRGASVDGANAAIRDSVSMRQVVEAFRNADLNAMNRNYIANRAHFYVQVNQPAQDNQPNQNNPVFQFTSPLHDTLRELAAPTVEQRLATVNEELANLVNGLPAQGQISEEQRATLASLSQRIIALRLERETRGAECHVSDGQLARRVEQVNTQQFGRLMENCGQDVALTRELTTALSNGNLTGSALQDKVERLENGVLADRLSFFHRLIDETGNDVEIPAQSVAGFRQRLVTAAARYTLRDNRAEALPAISQAPDGRCNNAEMEQAEQHVREQQTAFMNALNNAPIRTIGDIKTFKNNMAAARYDRIMAELREKGDSQDSRGL